MTDNLTEAAEADHEHAAFESVGDGNAVHRLTRGLDETSDHDHHQRCQHHREHDDRGHVGVHGFVDDADGSGRAVQNERELTALRHQHRAIQSFLHASCASNARR